jgi:hypothetical protein
MLNRLRNRGIKTRILNPIDALWDYRLGVQTFGFHPASGNEGDGDWRLHYTPTPYSDILKLLKMIDIGQNDVFVDLGAGLGRAVFAASYLGARRSIGVEIVPGLCSGAESNRVRSALASRDIQFVCGNAQNYDHHDTTVIFMFHPFGIETTRKVLQNIEARRADKATPPPFRVIYMNPVYDELFEQCGWLERIARLPPPRRWLSAANSYYVSLWRSLPQS